MPIFVIPESIKPTLPKEVKPMNENALINPVKKKISVHFEKWNKHYKVPPQKNMNDKPKTLLENGEDAGLILPYSCRAGMCGRCIAKLVSGEVEHTSSDGLTDQEKKEGYVLCCSTIALSDVVIKHQ
jgi:ferredoxin